ncbi:hypothetical protein BDY24DRAFT_433393 [Mrakia frigida]|uniref:Iba57p n=1 Tax=Mrakia frigida TaxID=29902 RepID=UPI003FCBEFCD
MFNHLPLQLQLLTSSALSRSSVVSIRSLSTQPRRSYSSSLPSSSSTSIFPSSSPVPHRSVISVGGKDATKFLNGITGVKIPDSFSGRPFYGSFLHAQGRILFDVHLYPHPPTSSFLIDFDSRTSPALIPAIKKFVLRSKVSLKDVSDQWDVWAAWDHEQAKEDGLRSWKWGTGESAGLVGWEKEQTMLPGTSGGAEGESPVGLEEEVGGWDLRAPGMGWRGLVRKGGRPSLASPSTSSSPPDPSSYTLHRILHGVPEGIEDIVPMSALPSESNLDFMGGVDFRKGCYVGQELTVRTYHTGATRKRIVPVKLVPLSTNDSDASSSSPLPLPTPSTDVRLVAISPSPSSSTSPSSPAPSSRGRSSGKILSSVRTPEGDVVGLALLRLEQVGSVWRGEGEMSVEGEGEGAGKWKVEPREVGWWPKREVEVEVGERE